MRTFEELFEHDPGVRTDPAFKVAFEAALRAGFEPDGRPVVQFYYDGKPRIARVMGSMPERTDGTQQAQAVLKLRHDPRQRLQKPAECLIVARQFLSGRETRSIVAPRLLAHATDYGTQAAWPWVIEEYLGEPLHDHTLHANEREHFAQGLWLLQQTLGGMASLRAATPEERTAVALHTARMDRWWQLCEQTGSASLVSQYFDAYVQQQMQNRVIGWYVGTDAKRMFWEHGAPSPRRFVPLPAEHQPASHQWGVLSWEHLAPRPTGYAAAYAIWVCCIMHPNWQGRSGDTLLTDVQEWIDCMVRNLHPFRVEGDATHRARWLRIALLERCFGTIAADIGGQVRMSNSERNARLQSLVPLVTWLLDTTAL